MANFMGKLLQNYKYLQCKTFRILFKHISDHLSVFFLICMTVPLRDAAPEYHFASNGQKVYDLLFMNDLKLYATNESHLNH